MTDPLSTPSGRVKRPPRRFGATSPEWRAYLKAIGYVMPCYCKGTPRNTTRCSKCGGRRGDVD